MKLIQQLMREIEEEKKRKLLNEKLTLVLEHYTYKNIPGTKNSFRQDAANTNTKTQRHAHAYAKPNGNGKELYSVNLDGSGHDGSSGIAMPSSHADYFRNLGYKISATLVLESLNFSDINPNDYSICILEEVA